MDPSSTPTPAAAPAAPIADPIDASGVGIPAPAAAVDPGQAQPATPAAPATPDAIPTPPAQAGVVDYAVVKQRDGLGEHAALSSDEMKAFLELSQSLGDTPEVAQKRLDFETQNRETFWNNHMKQVDDWLKDCKSDPELAGKDGAQWGKTEATVQKVMARFGNEEVRTLLDVTGLGNHPAFVKWVNAIGQSMSEETLALTGGSAPSAGAKKPEDTLYKS